MSGTSLRGSVSALTGEGRGRLLASVAVGWFLVLGMRFVVPGILPTITAGFDATGAQAGLAVTVLWVTYAAMQFPAGYYIDRLGERPLLTAGLAISAGALVTYTFTPTFGLFVVATGVFGLGSGLYGPPRGTVVAKTYDENDGAAFGAVLGAGSVGAAALPALAALAVARVGWRTTLGVAAPAFLLAAVAVWWAVPDTRLATDGDAASLGDTVRAAARGVRDRRIALAVGGATVMLFVFQAATAFLTTYLVDAKGLSQGTAGALLGVLFVVGAGAQWTFGGLADRFGTPRVLTAVAAGSVLPLLALPLVEGRLALSAVAALIGVRMSIGPVSNAYIIDLLPDSVEGAAWGALRTGLFLVGSFGSTVVGVMADAGLFDAAFYLLAGLTGLGAVVYARLPERP
jgi:predicted MFS family arabinose efflux permease